MQLIWLRSDLRITDNSALSAACERGPTVAVWLASPGHDPAFRATIGKRRRDILDRLDYGTHRAGDKVVKGCALPFADPAKNLPETVRLVVDNGTPGRSV